MDRSEKFWDRQADSFNGQGESDDPTWLKTVEKTKRHLQASDVVLDYGCATGGFAFSLAGLVQDIQGIDISSRMIEAAERNAHELKVENVHFARATIFDDRLEGESFSVVMALNLLHLVDDAGQTLQRIHQLLTPGGLLISATACMGESMSLFRLVLKPLSKIGIVPTIRFFKVSELEELIAREGFQVIETETLSRRSANHFVVAKKMERA